jgi:hypothetical protein
MSKSDDSTPLDIEPLASLGSATSAAIHEINNLLIPLEGLLDVLRECAEEGRPPDLESLDTLAVCQERLRTRTSALTQALRQATGPSTRRA